MPQRTILATDTFSRVDGPNIGGIWDPQPGQGSYSIVSNVVSPASVSADSAESYNAVTWPNDQWAQANCTTAGGAASGRGPGVGLRMSAAAQTGYQCVINEDASNNINVYKFVAGVYTSIVSYTVTYAAGGILCVEIVDTTIYTYYQGILIGMATDTSIASGRAGLVFASATTTSSLDNWKAGGSYIFPPPPRVLTTAIGRAASW